MIRIHLRFGELHPDRLLDLRIAGRLLRRTGLCICLRRFPGTGSGCQDWLSESRDGGQKQREENSLRHWKQTTRFPSSGECPS